MIDRRAFISGATVGLLAAPLAAGAAQAGKVWRLGILSPSTTPVETARRQSPLMQKLVELGYVENQNLVVEYRAAEGKIDRLPDLAVELVQAKVDAIFTASSPGVQAARKATSVIPIVFTGVNDPVGLGLVASLARPGGNVTAFRHCSLATSWRSSCNFSRKSFLGCLGLPSSGIPRIPAPRRL